MAIGSYASGVDGLTQLRMFLEAGGRGPMGETMNFAMVEVEEGRAVFESSPQPGVLNPHGWVHGGYAATLLDSACGCAVHSRLGAGQTYMTLEMKIAYHRALTAGSGPVRAEGRLLNIGRRTAFSEGKLVDGEGRLCASATATFLIVERESR